MADKSAVQAVGEHAQLEPGFSGAIIVLLALAVLYLIATGLWDRLGPAWATFWDTLPSHFPNQAPKPSWPPSLDLPPMPWPLHPSGAGVSFQGLGPATVSQSTPGSEVRFGVGVGV